MMRGYTLLELYTVRASAPGVLTRTPVSLRTVLANKAVPRKALTLIEIIISLVIFVVTITGLTSVFINSSKSMLHSRSRMASSELGRYFLDPLQMDVNQATWGSNCLSSGTGCPGMQTVDGIQYTPTYDPPSVAFGLPKVRVTIAWTENTS